MTITAATLVEWNHFDRVMKFNKKIFRIIKYMSLRNKLNKRIFVIILYFLLRDI